jgi:hypothetical protein
VMKELLKNIFAVNGFSERKINGDTYFFEAKDSKKSEYYLIDFIESDKIKGYLNTDALESVFTLFNDQKKEKQDIEKNTSLIICLRLNNIKEDIEGIRNDILRIEEDDYWFKKYVIVYSDNSLPQPTDGIDYIEYFNGLLADSERFKEYKSDIYQNEGYYLAIQIFLKIPFINVPVKITSSYRSIEDLVAEKLSATEKDLLYKLRSLSDINDPAFWEVIKSDSVLAGNGSTSINDFLDRFKPNA